MSRDPLAVPLNYAINASLNTIPPVKGHTVSKSDVWTCSLWDSKDIWFDDRHIIDDIEKLERELHSDLTNNRNTTPRPIKFENYPKVITLIGLTESAKRDTDEVSSDLQYIGIGDNTGATGAAEGNTQLDSEFANTLYARKDLAVTGQRKVINQPAKYGVLWDDTSFDTAGQTIKEAGIFWVSTGNNVMHARVITSNFTLSAGLLFVIQINELQENG